MTMIHDTSTRSRRRILTMLTAGAATVAAVPLLAKLPAVNANALRDKGMPWGERCPVAVDRPFVLSI